MADMFSIGHLESSAYVKGLNKSVCINERTFGDGACGVHALFGERTPSGYYLSEPRKFVANLFGNSFFGLRYKVNDEGLIQEFEDILWQENVKPNALGQIAGDQNVEREGTLLWKSISKRADLLRRCVGTAQRQLQAYNDFNLSLIHI